MLSLQNISKLFNLDFLLKKTEGGQKTICNCVLLLLLFVHCCSKFWGDGNVLERANVVLVMPYIRKPVLLIGLFHSAVFFLKVSVMRDKSNNAEHGTCDAAVVLSYPCTSCTLDVLKPFSQKWP